MRKVFGTPQRLSVNSPLFWYNLNLRTLAIKNELLALAFGALNGLGFEVWFWKGVVLIDASLVCLALLPNFYDKNLAAFRLIFVAKIW